MNKYIEKYDEDVHSGLLVIAAMSGINTEATQGAERYIGYGDTKEGFGPACILDVCGTEYVAEPHVTWFPWTNGKNRISNFKWAMEYLAQDRQVFLVAEKKETNLFDHFVKKNVLRKVGHLINIPIVKEIHFYQYDKGASNE